ncbi:sigma-54-dependent Fis family transcriptional regulator [Sporosarcina sp. NCCP-2716]|uniref:PAS domain-containing protein n=1 Tax=Sporosarcina sp. NCCP-2716 TaxID=2943679 RepID=UPI002041D51C|nr:PAS domain-containing protein [Sporosarcina sp. NCCP-2716]GKV68131.1 sigma-54-dependent Fis family transcriptional regulator [Sporosarcina sp. NCCP-2716]
MTLQKALTDISAYQAIFHSVEEGMISVDAEGLIHLFNDSASKMLGIPGSGAAGRRIEDVIPSSGLPEVLRSGEAVSNTAMQLPSGMNLLSSRYPILDADGTVTGAFAVFKDITGVIETAEEITDLKRVKTMLEAIIHSSDDAISVVDADGLGILINPAYTRLTGLSEKEVIGQPATADISSGESIHMKVLETKRPVRGVNMRIGGNNRDVIVNVAPIVVDREVKGSVGVIHDITEMRSLMRQLDHAKAQIRELESAYTFEDIIGDSEDLNIAVGQAKISAGSDIPVMLRGEPGTGKGLFAHAIHTGSKRSGGEFIRISCSSLSCDSAELSRIHTQIKEGELTGTLFLDEITELDPAVQQSLLTYLKSGISSSPGQAGMRVIASSSANLERAVHDGSLSEELYFQLTRMSIRIPPLRSRPGDIPKLAEVLLAMLNEEYGMSVTVLTDGALKRLQSYEWPGNVRELENALSRAMILSETGSSELAEDDIARALSTGSESGSGTAIPEKRTLASLMEDHEKHVLQTALKENGGQKAATADKLGISLRSLYYKLEKYKLI